jgi:hypothetical protein
VKRKAVLFGKSFVCYLFCSLHADAGALLLLLLLRLVAETFSFTF